MKNNNLDNINMSDTVAKRKATILRKREMKEAKKAAFHSKREDKYILQAGNAYADENVKVNEKFVLPVKDIQRERKKYERNLDKEAINGMFQLKVYDDEDLLNIKGSTVVASDGSTYFSDKWEPNYNYIKTTLRNVFTREVTNNSKNLKISQYVTIKYQVKRSVDDVGEEDELIRYFNSDISVLTSVKIIEGIINNIIASFEKEIDETNKNHSGSLDKIIKMEIKMSKSKNIYGGLYVELPEHIKSKKACVNIVNLLSEKKGIKTYDNKCFLWSLIASKHYDDVKKNEVRHYKKFISSVVVPDNYNYPVPIDDIPMWELSNNIKINVFTLDDKEENLVCEYSSIEKNKNLVNLLLYKNHYCWLKNIDRFDACNITQKCAIYRCLQCGTKRFDSKEKLDKHVELCVLGYQGVEEIMPQEGKNTLKFIHECNTFKHPFHVVADFESTLEKVAKVVEGDEVESTVKYQKHVANSYGLKYNCIHHEYSKPIKIFNSSNPEEVIKNFIFDLEALAVESFKISKQNEKNINISEEQKMKHKSTKKCFYCRSYFTDKNKRVKHHDHITGQFINTCCNQCNLQFTYKKFLPVYIHNLKGYDSHLFVTGLFKYGYQENKTDNISCIPNNEERYISFSKKIKVDSYFKLNEKTKKMEEKTIYYELRFLDTFAFMASSIDSLSENLRKSSNNINDLRKVFKNTSEQFNKDDEFLLMIEKGIYPYDYIDNYERLYETKLPNIEDFYSYLNNKECKLVDYNKAVNIWSKFQCSNLLDYHNLYLKTDVLLLADIWENFREVCYKNYNLDCEYYYTAPSLSFDSMLKYTKIELELLTCSKMFKFVESGIRGGISQISKRYAEANNKYMEKYDENKEESYILYLDANNLYGYAMCQHLPTHNFKWNNEVWTKEKIMNLDDKGQTGYLFSVDLSLNDKLHDYFNNYPLCPENISIKKDNLNEWQQENYKETKIEKLCLTFNDKNNYIINYRYLKLALSLGYTFKKVNEVLEYSQSDFLSKYIMLNTQLRTKASNDFEKDFYKLMNNSVYGKTMENVRNRINFRLISTDEEAMRVKNMRRFTIFNENLVGLHISKEKVVLNKPIYLGQNILDDSKVLMSNFHYNFMLKKIERHNVDLLFTDTDSLCYHVRNHDIFKIMKDNKDEFDLSDYPKDHELYDPKNKKVIGKMKNESVKIDKYGVYHTNIITTFIGLRSKLYSFKETTEKEFHKHEDETHNKCKGVKKYVNETLTIKDYETTLRTKENKTITQNCIRSHQHEIFSESQSKIGLSCYDDKVYINDDLITTYNFGHYKIRN
jgi:hypothetical protein